MILNLNRRDHYTTDLKKAQVTPHPPGGGRRLSRPDVKGPALKKVAGAIRRFA
jgi:hypothetical protein